MQPNFSFGLEFELQQCELDDEFINEHTELNLDLLRSSSGCHQNEKNSFKTNEKARSNETSQARNTSPNLLSPNVRANSLFYNK
jgi:hypothetical protein